jgi:hypothetical protein
MNNKVALIVLICLLTFFIWFIQKWIEKKREIILQQKTEAEIRKFQKEFWDKAHDRKHFYYQNGGLNIENKTVFDFNQNPEILKRLITFAFKKRTSFESLSDKSSEMSIEDFYEWNVKGTRAGQLNMLMDLAEITDNEKLKHAVIFEQEIFDEYCNEMANRFGIIIN